MKIYVWAVVVVALANIGAVKAAPPAQCDLRLTVQLTPDVPDPPDVGFLSSLLDDQVSYQLTLLEVRNDSVVVELTGPGPAYRCRRAVNAIRKDGRVLSVHVDRSS